MNVDYDLLKTCLTMGGPGATPPGCFKLVCMYKCEDGKTNRDKCYKQCIDFVAAAHCFATANHPVLGCQYVVGGIDVEKFGDYPWGSAVPYGPERSWYS